MPLYLIYRKRSHTNNIRTQDRLLVVDAERYHPPFPKGVGLGMKNVNWWPRDSLTIQELNNENSLTNLLRTIRSS